MTRLFLRAGRAVPAACTLALTTGLAAQPAHASLSTIAHPPQQRAGQPGRAHCPTCRRKPRPWSGSTH
ncbi:hypothetical protein SRIMM317S_04008 [Streptomyces rimosus subsp. rimosus]